MKQPRLFSSNEIYIDEFNDRIILIVRDQHEIVGLNFCQGTDMEVFCDHYNEIDHKLTETYRALKNILVGDTEMDKINNLMWAWFEFPKSIRE
jgi:hypothetical protein